MAKTGEPMTCALFTLTNSVASRQIHVFIKDDFIWIGVRSICDLLMLAKTSSFIRDVPDEKRHTFNVRFQKQEFAIQAVEFSWLVYALRKVRRQKLANDLYLALAQALEALPYFAVPKISRNWDVTAATLEAKDTETNQADLFAKPSILAPDAPETPASLRSDVKHLKHAVNMLFDRVSKLSQNQASSA
jgi:hypothetical protein